MNKKNKIKRLTNDNQFIDDYNYIMNLKTFTANPTPMVEWKTKGDNFRKLSLYKNYPPSKTTSSTTLI
ncbi:MAG TPA: hypothetical protein PLS10_03700 [Chitinophagales bacterium]|nr:hypothetical protein [Chitinophagales bacterium]